jgi:hypothetical protein
LHGAKDAIIPLLQAPYTSVETRAAELYPFVIGVRHLVRDKYDSLSKIASGEQILTPLVKQQENTGLSEALPLRSQSHGNHGEISHHIIVAERRTHRTEHNRRVIIRVRTSHDFVEGENALWCVN